MNYIAEINAFYDYLIENPMSGNAQALWHRLMAYCNVFDWKAQFSISNGRLVEDLGISRQELDRVRNLLQQKNIIVYEKGSGNTGGVYHMNSFASQKNADSVTQYVTQTGHKPVTSVAQTGQSADTLNKRKLNKTKRNKTKVNPLTPESGEQEKTFSEKDELSQIFTDGTKDFSPELLDKTKQWIAYKLEKNQKYKPTGLESLLTEIDNNRKKYGETAVIGLISQSMAANYTGITFDKLKQNGKSPPGEESGGYEPGSRMSKITF